MNPHASLIDCDSRLDVPVPRPVPALERLLALLSGAPATDPLPTASWPTIGDGEFAVPAALVVAVQGADGDPELEWDDLAEQWVASPEVSGAVNVAEAEDWFNDLRSFCGELTSHVGVVLRLPS